MKKLLIFTMVVFVGASCNNGETAQGESEKKTESTPLSGVVNNVFTGTTPCADCPGIYTVVEFAADSTFFEYLKYMERPGVFTARGRWILSDSIISVNYENNGQNRFFKVMNDSEVRMLDAYRNVITGPLEDAYILKKKDTVIRR